MVVVAPVLLAPTPQGSEVFTDKPVPLFAVVVGFIDQGLALALDEDVLACHGSSFVIAEVRPLVSDDQGSSIEEREIEMNARENRKDDTCSSCETEMS